MTISDQAIAIRPRRECHKYIVRAMALIITAWSLGKLLVSENPEREFGSPNIAVGRVRSANVD